jgi:peptidoglycan-N-acetylglucosamine deacetylase
MVVAAVFPLVTAERTHDLTPPITVRVAGRARYLAPGVTFGRVITQYGLHASSGNFLDVTGQVLQGDAYPGRIVLNGHEAAPATHLDDGDRVVVENGADRTEGTIPHIVPLPHPVPSDPQFSLGLTPGERVIVEGRVSHKVVSTSFRPTGPTVQPNAVALTFDDGPNPLASMKILHILTKRRVPATFFTIGSEVAAHPEIVRAETAAGMEVGNHTWDHPESPFLAELSPARIREEMVAASDALGQAGVTPTLFRSPAGSVSDTVVAIADSLGMRVVSWSVDPQDWRDNATAKQIVKTVLSNVKPGSIVLLHDGGGPQLATVKALPKIIKGIRKRHLRLMQVQP